MNDKRERPPWWTIYLSPSIIPMLPFLLMILLVPLVALLLPLVRLFSRVVSLMKFSIRDLLSLMVLAAVLTVWGVEDGKLSARIRSLEGDPNDPFAGMIGHQGATRRSLVLATVNR